MNSRRGCENSAMLKLIEEERSGWWSTWTRRGWLSARPEFGGVEERK
jgi:hypothetical protein